MFDVEMRRIKDRILDPTARFLGSALHPTAISVAGFFIGIGSLALIILNMPWFALGLWLLNRVLDGLDGAVARASGKASDLGGYIDIVLDFILYAAFPLVMAYNAGAQAFIAAAVLLGSFYINAAVWMSASALLEKRKRTGVAGDREGKTSMIMPRGLVEGFETILIFSLMIVFPAQFEILAWIMAGLVFIGVILRLISMMRVLSGE